MSPFFNQTPIRIVLASCLILKGFLMRMALAQLKLSDTIQKNKDKTISAIEEASANATELICFPELQLYPFFPQHREQSVEEYSLAIDDPFVSEMQATCKRLSIVAVPNIYLKEKKWISVESQLSYTPMVVLLQKLTTKNRSYTQMWI